MTGIENALQDLANNSNRHHRCYYHLPIPERQVSNGEQGESPTPYIPIIPQ